MFQCGMVNSSATPLLPDSSLPVFGADALTPNRVPATAESGPRFSPLYQQIKNLITEGLKEGQWRPGESIPSEMELAQKFQVSQGTVRKAIDELAAEHILQRRQGKGTFVATHQESRVQFRFLRLRPNEGPAKAQESEVLDCRRLRAPVEVARVLGLKPGEAALQVTRCLSFGGVPTVADEIWLPGIAFRGLTLDRLRSYKGPLYAFFEAEFGTRMIRCEERVSAKAAPPEIAHILRIAAGTPLLAVERISFTYSGQACEFRRAWYLTDDHHYFSEFV
jgi:GntR family transcriptional regulator